MSTDPRPTASAGGAPAGMPARLWELAKHGARGTIPQWVRDTPDAGATAPPRIGQIARRAAQAAAAAGVVAGGIGVGIAATEVASHPVGVAHPDDGALTVDHISTDAGTDSPASSHSGGASGPPGSGSEGGVTLHTSSDSGHLTTGLASTWQIPGHGSTGSGHGSTGGGHGEAGAGGGHEGLTVEMYQDVAVHEGADGMFSVDAVEYVVVRDEHGHTYVFHENYHTVVPDPPGQETDLVVNETDRVQVVEHPDGSFSVTQADNSISVTVGSDGDGRHEVTVTQTESVQIGHDPDADGHDTASLTENEYGGTSSDQSEVVTEQTLPSGAASSQVGTAQPTPPESFTAGPVIATPPPLATSLGVAPATVGGLTSGGEPNPQSAFAGLHGGPAEPGHGTVPAGHFPNEPVLTQHPAGGAFESASSSTAPRSFEHPTADPPAAAAGPDPHPGAAFADHDQPGLDEPGAHAGIDLTAVDPTEPGPSADSAGEHEEASGAHPDSSAGSADVASGHNPGSDTLIH